MSRSMLTCDNGDEGVVRAALEMVSTEKSLLDDLIVLSTVFVGPLRDWSSMVAGGIANGDVDGEVLAGLVERMFAPLDAVVTICKKMLELLEAALKDGDWARAFEGVEERLVGAYGAYVRQFNGVWPQLTELRSKSVALESFLKCCELQPANTRKLTLASLAIMPAQRPPRYVLLVCELKKRHEKSGFSGSTLTKAEASARRAATAVDGQIRDEEQRRARLERACGMFHTCEATLGWLSFRNIICDAPISRITKRGPLEAYFVLFSHALCYGDVDKIQLFSSGFTRRMTLGGGDSPTSPNASIAADIAAASQEDDEYEAGGQHCRYVLHRELAVEEVYASLGGQTTGVQQGGLASWEFIVLSKEKSFVVATKDIARAKEWVDRIEAAGSARAASLGLKREPPKSASAYLSRSGKVTTEDFDFELVGANLVAKPAGYVKQQQIVSPSGIGMPGLSRQSSNPVPPTPIAATHGSKANRGDVYTVTVPIHLENGLGLEAQNDIANGVVRVHSLAMPSVAADAGVLPRDEIIKICEDDVNNTSDVIAALRSRRHNATVSITLRRPFNTHHQGQTIIAGPKAVPTPIPFRPAAAYDEPRPPPPELHRPADNDGNPLFSLLAPLSASSRQPFGEWAQRRPDAVVARVVAMGLDENEAKAAVAAGITDDEAVINWILDNRRNNNTARPPPPPLTNPPTRTPPLRAPPNPFR